MALASRVRTRSRAIVAQSGAPAPDVKRRTRTFNRGDAVVLAGSVVSSFFLVFIVYWWLTPSAGTVGFALWWFASFLVMYGLAERRLHGGLVARDRLWSVVIIASATLMLAPLALIVGFVLSQGIRVIGPTLFTQDAQQCAALSSVSSCGVGHAIVGSLEQVGIAILIAVPLAVLCAVFLNEIGGPLRRPTRIFVDAMSGVPSIVAGLFIYAIVVVRFGFSGVAAALALAILMLPTVTRTSEEVLRLVPDGLREGSLALGASEWRTVWSVVLPTARSGLITAVVLGVARAVGETAPIIVTALGASAFNVNPFSGPQEALPFFVFDNIRHSQPGSTTYVAGWAAAVVLILLVLALFTLARAVGTRMSVESRQRRAVRREARIAGRRSPASEVTS
jgi:phosphate transport system permease protein